MKRVIFTLAFFLCITALQAQPLRIGVAGVTHDHLGGVVSALRGGIAVAEGHDKYQQLGIDASLKRPYLCIRKQA